MITSPELPVEAERRLAGRADFIDRMLAFYRRIDARIAANSPACRNRGECCHFARFGHKLFVTSAELACFLGTVDHFPGHQRDEGCCPYHIGGLCTARIGRPLGCRVFFCESAGDGWQEDLTESALAELREIHAAFDLPYVYMEWLDALRQTC